MFLCKPKLQKLFDFGFHALVVFSFMRKRAVDARLYAFFGVIEVAAAVFAQGVERTIAEKAVEIFFRKAVRVFVAGEHLAHSVLKKFVMRAFERFAVLYDNHSHVTRVWFKQGKIAADFFVLKPAV